MNEFIGKSKASLRLKAQLDVLKKQSVDVLLIGEIGTGRDFCAEYLSQNNYTDFTPEAIQNRQLDEQSIYENNI